jgi:WD40 repeat protein
MSRLAFASDGTWLATVSGLTVRICDAATGEEQAVLADHTGEVSAVAIAPDGVRLATASQDRTVRIWNAVTGRCRVALTGYTGEVSAVAVPVRLEFLVSWWSARIGGWRIRLSAGKRYVRLLRAPVAVVTVRGY